MTGKNTLAMVVAWGAIGAAIGYGAEKAGDANALENAEIAQTCYNIYYSDPRVIGARVIECMKYGWVPTAGSIDTTEFGADNPVELLNAYIRIEEERGNNFNGEEAAALSWAGGVGGLFFSLWPRARRRREVDPPREETEGSEEEPEVPEEETRPTEPAA